MSRRRVLGGLSAGGVVAALGGLGVVACDRRTEAARKEKRDDGRSRLPPGQYLIDRIRPMGGEEGDGTARSFRLEVHGLVERPTELDFAALLALPQIDQVCDVHCVTKWSVLGAKWTGVKLTEIASLVGVLPRARHVIFEAAFGYTSNVPIDEALRPNVILAHRYEGEPLPLPHGAPVRAVVPDLYFWKSAKWLTGVRFVEVDEPGFWETRGYHNHADPWKEERTTGW